MAIISFRSDEIHCKIVYYGPGRGGKTTNLIAIHKALGHQVRGELLSIDTSGDRTLFFDFLPMDLGTIGKFRIKISLYTVPGQVRYNDTRKLVLKGVDGIVFVADSLEARRNNNIESLLNLDDNLRDQGKTTTSLPLVLQFNKRDLTGSRVAVLPVEEMEKDLNPASRFPAFPASALKGDGVRETFKKICMMTVIDVSTKTPEGQRDEPDRVGSLIQRFRRVPVSEKKYKTPDELGEAVGLKIEELFGTMVHDLPPEEPEPQSTVQEQREKVPVAPTSPPSTPGSTPREARSPRGSIAASPPSSASNAQKKAGNTCAEILERIEILMLKLEWEVNPESVREIFQKFMELERFFSADRSALNILAMNRRVLPRFKDPEAVPHRSLLRLLQDSITALKGIHSSQGRQRPSEKLMASITNSYKEIVSSLPVSGAASKSMGETKEQGSRQRYVSLIANFGGTIRSINEVNRRLGKILGVLRQGGGMSGEEISRRLGALENLIAERVEHLSTFHNELVHIGAPTDADIG